MEKMVQIFLLMGGPVLRWGGLLIVAAAIFIADTATDFEIAVAVLYAAIILIGANILSYRGIQVMSAVCVTLTLLSFAFTQSGSYEAGIINSGLSLCAIGVTTYLVLSRFIALHSENEARTQLARMTRISSLGELSASIAHEVNQPLAAIVTSGNAGVRWLSATPPNVKKARQALERIINDANRASEIVTHIRTLARRAPPISAKLDASAILDDIEILSRCERNRHSIPLFRILPDDIPPLWADGVQIKQVLLNFILNSIEAMTRTPVEDRNITIALSREDSGFVKFSIHDNGHGIALKDYDKVFDAFYTTKPDGLGIGLAISRSIIEAHGGHIWAEAPEKGGATFHFTVPVYRTIHSRA